MTMLTVPYSGRLLVGHMVAYGLAMALEENGIETFIDHDPESLEMNPRIFTDADADLIAQCVRASATACESAVERDLDPGRSGNDRIPVLRARATASDRVARCFDAREQLLDELEADRAALALALAAGLGTPAAWLREAGAGGKSLPHRGASALDGVPYNSTSDVVRGALRRSRPEAAQVTRTQVAELFAGHPDRRDETDDRQRWSPAGTPVASWCQWLADLGLCLLPVGLQAHSAAVTPAFRDKRITLPVLSRRTSVHRLRAVLQLQTLVVAGVGGDGSKAAAASLRALGICEVVSFIRRDASNATMVSFSFEPATRIPL